MPRPQVERIRYPAERETVTSVPTTKTPAPNFWSLDHDNRNWVRQGKHFSMHANERVYMPTKQGASASDFYNTDQASKVSLGRKVQRSPYRYVSMIEKSHGRDVSPAIGHSYAPLMVSTTERGGPGAYSPGSQQMPRWAPNTSAFASGLPRCSTFDSRASSEPAYSTLETDEKLRKLHENGQTKGATFAMTQRWQRPAGPGSNRPSDKATPGPGAYGKLHSWPGKGFMGTAYGFNHVG